MDNKIVFGIMTIIFNCYGVPNFMIGDVKTGVLKIVLGVVTCSIVMIINAIKGIIQGIAILKMTDEEFAAANKADLVVGIPSGKPKAEAE